jgi:hypothetical protein
LNDCSINLSSSGFKMYLRTGLFKKGIILAGVFGLLFFISQQHSPETDSGVNLAVGEPVAIASGHVSLAAANGGTQPSFAEAIPSVPDAGWINNEGKLTAETAQLVSWVEAGYPLDVRIDGNAPVRYGFRPVDLTTENFQVSAGTSTELPAQFHVFSGRELGASGVDEAVSLAIVNGAISMAVTLNGRNYMVETDPSTGELYASDLQPFDSGHSCGSEGCGNLHIQCQLSSDGKLAAASAPAGVENMPRPRIPVSLVYPGDRIDTAAIIETAESQQFESATAGKPYMRHGSEYDASLRDIIVLMVSSKSQSGQTSGLSSKAASYFANAARVADVYERQLGLRYLLQELILVPSDSPEADPGNPSGTTLGEDLYHLGSWISSNRPQSTYKWGHVALWTLVDGGSGGVVGLAWTDCYGQSSYGHSVQEPSWGWEVHAHELGHNVGSSHSSGGVMNPSLILGNENFFTFVSGQSYTSAKDIYNYMSSPTKPYVFGPALLRHPEEMPFGVDDTVSTPVDTALSFDPLSNDLVAANNGSANTLRLVEVGQVLPKAAGSAQVANGEIFFTPASGFTGQAWFSYTLGGDVGNGGLGWLHRADVVVTVGGSSAAPSASPVLRLSNDTIVGELNDPIRINPLLNDEGSGRLWSGDVEVLVGPNDTTPESYSEGAFWLVDATVITGTGSLSLEKRNMTRSTSNSPQNSGYLTYTPGQNEGGEVIIEYTVSDANGNTATAQIIIAEAAAVGVLASTDSVSEDSGEIVTLTFNRSGAADTSLEEQINFSITGTAVPSGLPADFALAGQDAFDPISRTGSITIPVGETQAFIYIAIDDDGSNEGQESFGLTITGTSSLMVGSNASVEVFISDSSLVYAESFDGFSADSATWNGWSNFKDKRSNGKGGEDWFDWAVDSQTTPTSGTGPSVDHTIGSGKYLYAEASGNPDVYSLLQSPVIPVSGATSANLEFWYHMYGTGMGTLTLDLYVNGALAAPAVWSASGQQSTTGTDWKKASLALDGYFPANSVQLRFRADTTSSELGDIAIDDIQIVGASNVVPQAPSIWIDPAGCTVDEGDSVYLSVIAEGYPAPQIQWVKNGTLIPGATGASYYISSASGSSAGSYKALVSNSQGSLYSFEALIELPPEPPSIAYFNWLNDNGLGEEDGVETADPDFDGIINLFEFAFGLNPNTPDPNGSMPMAQFNQDSGSTYLEIQYRRLKGGTGTDGVNYTIDGITYTVETSTTMDSGSWVSGSGNVQMVGSPVDNGDGTETVAVRRLSPIGSGCAFIRVSVVSN